MQWIQNSVTFLPGRSFLPTLARSNILVMQLLSLNIEGMSYLDMELCQFKVHALRATLAKRDFMRALRFSHFGALFDVLCYNGYYLV